MSITNLTRSLVLALAAALIIVPSAGAQQNNRDFSPFIDPLSFNPDYQFFAPAELGDFGNVPDPNTGWFAEYNRMYIYVTRPDREQSYTDGDFTWGNRYDIGYMTEDNRGWWFSGLHIDGPNEYDVLRHPRVNRDNTDDRDDPTQGGGGGGGGGGAQVQAPVFPIQDRVNTVDGGGARDYDIHQSMNVAKLSGFEMNHVWRLDQLHSGGTLEPFCGIRYMIFRDYTRRDTYRRLDPTGVTNPLPNTTDTIEEIGINNTWWGNHMVGGQMGLRWVETRSRWKTSSEIRAFAFQNFQSYSDRQELYQILYDSAAIDADIDAEKYTRTGSANHSGEFVLGGEVQADAAFELTRDISLNMGIQFMYFGRGIARGNSFAHNSEDLLMIGGTFGATLNR